jgi:hypothetical protein
MFYNPFLPQRSVKLGSILTDIEGRTTERAESSSRRNHNTDGVPLATPTLGMQRLQMREFSTAASVHSFGIATTLLSFASLEMLTDEKENMCLVGVLERRVDTYSIELLHDAGPQS